MSTTRYPDPAYVVDDGQTLGDARVEVMTRRIEAWFTYHPPQIGQPERYEAIRAAAKELAYVIVRNTPKDGPDQTCALRHVRDAVMTANAAIALENERL